MTTDRALLLRVFLIIFILVLLTGCSTTTPQNTSSSNLTLKLISSADLNPNLFGRPSPLYITVFQLLDTDVFNQTDFFGLQNQSEQLLGKNLLAKKTLLILPAESRDTTLNLNPQIRYLGVVASYTQLDTGTWRAVLPVTVKTNAVTLQFDRNNVNAREN